MKPTLANTSGLRTSRPAKPGLKLEQIVDRDLRKGGSEGSELTLLQSDRRRETRSLHFPLASRSRLGRLEHRAAGEMADAGDRLTGGVIG
jgi:hypothetical protein